MKRSVLNLAIAVAAGAVLAGQAQAAQFVVTVGSLQAIPGNNNFQATLNGLGLFDYTDANASISLTDTRKLKFEYLGKEAGFTNTFEALPLSYTAGPPNFQDLFGAPLQIGTRTQAAGAITDWHFIRPDAAKFGIGTPEFGIFLPRGLQGGGTYNSRVLYLGFDDTGAGPDDNHDDMIIRVSMVPEPAMWAMMIAGFGMVGITARRRRRTAAA